jgi:hypothetical protein
MERLANGFLSEGGDKLPAPVVKLREVRSLRASVSGLAA